MSPNRTSEWKGMTISVSRELLLFNFERLGILCAWIGLPCDTLWPFEFLESFRCSISSVSIYYAPESDFLVIRYDHLNFSTTSVVQFQDPRYITHLHRTSEWNVMTIRISRQLRLFNYERLDEICPRIGHPSEKLWPFEFLKSIRCSIWSVSICYAP